ncbi:transferrin-binding protein-like solute binding protein [Haemophilus haemolyticus]|uniref:transferrin-binding protein-like solute binding protein n=1 Tax=Haemophilus haemolyticus TaxID=726 RepID=UPI000803BE77|nr:transferrin-binding protein-like solute binding protein [Haemophilus haemolyticus]OBX89377.1 transferrin-binding protein 2 [Haemophilus haemolyticus]
MKSVSLITGGLSFLLSACSAGGGGSFDVDNVSNTSSSKPNYQDDTSNSRTKSNLDQLFIPSLGGGMKLVAQNMHFKASKEPSLLNDYVVLTGLSSMAKDVENNNKNGDNPIGSIEEPLAINTTENHHGQRYVYSGLYYIPSWSLRDLPNNKFYSGYYGYAYYFGNQAASTLPINGVAKYKGTWDFITATQKGKNYELLRNSGGQAYSKRSATTSDMDLEVENNEGREKGLVSEFSADFGTKRLTGELFYTQSKNNNQEYKKEKLYDINADIYSNRFRGKVNPTQKDSEKHPFTSEGVLEGGFYGPNGEELGGKFLADDKRVFGVFSAKETLENSKLSKETLIDGKLTTFSTKTTDTTNFITKDIPSFGEADYLLIDNYPIPLLPENTGDFVTSKHHDIGNKSYKVEACCNNLNYVKFGMYYEDKPTKDKNNTNQTEQYHQFLLGHRTANAEIPKKGSAKYHGSWFGYISDGTTSYSTTGDKQRDKSGVSDFDVNFDNKTLKGELKRADTQNTVFNIDATFKNSGNAFTGTATAKDLVIDGKNSQTQNARINITTDVNGAFYGPHASELGGYFTYNGKNTATTNSENSSIVAPSSNSENARAAVVFGAKHQIEKTK